MKRCVCLEGGITSILSEEEEKDPNSIQLVANVEILFYIVAR